MDAARRYGVNTTGNTLVDFGCSDGALSRIYIQKGWEKVIGIDIDQKAIGRARALYGSSNISFYLSTHNSIPLENNSADAIYSFDVFEHVRLRVQC